MMKEKIPEIYNLVVVKFSALTLSDITYMSIIAVIVVMLVVGANLILKK